MKFGIKAATDYLATNPTREAINALLASTNPTRPRFTAPAIKAILAALKVK